MDKQQLDAIRAEFPLGEKPVAYNVIRATEVIHELLDAYEDEKAEQFKVCDSYERQMGRGNDINRAEINELKHAQSQLQKGHDKLKARCLGLLEEIDRLQTQLQYTDEVCHECLKDLHKMMNGKCGVFVGRDGCEADRLKAQNAELIRLIKTKFLGQRQQTPCSICGYHGNVNRKCTDNCAIEKWKNWQLAERFKEGE